MSQSIPDFVNRHPLPNPLHRLILCRIWMSGSSDGEGVRYLGLATMSDFCCCSVQELQAAIDDLVNHGCIARVQPTEDVRRITKSSDAIGFILAPALQVDSYETF
ncbi:hypothetical protein [Pantoea brenneri]|uniref:hypothetical protein n=1 Tax=Pantoea brenneri TaxID=472694 RepID=UPI0024475E82|nr:hypothetical protein [Pantoea brenneri]MDH1085965.1 hypothetical protein [Pantoea brenneri]